MVANGNDGVACNGRRNITVVNIAPSDVGQPYPDFDHSYANVGLPYVEVEPAYAVVGQPYANIGQPDEGSDQRYDDVGQSYKRNPSRSLSRQRHEPLQILDVDLEEYLEKHGCIIQRTFFNLPLDLNSFSNESYEESEEQELEAETSGGKSSLCHDDVITEQKAAITLQNNDMFAQAQSKVTVNKGFIVDQNVGVSGEVSMVYPNRPTDQVKEFPINSPAKRSPTVVYIGTLEQIEEDMLIKQVDIVETIEENESGPSSVTLSFYETSPEIARKRSPSSKTSDDAEIIADEGGQGLLSGEKSSLVAPALLMQWRVRPPDSDDARREDVDSPVTPSSSMFSSAYTVTELGSDNSSDHSPPSESSNSTISSRRASEMGDGLGRPDDCYLKFQEYLQLFRQLSTFNNALFFEDSSEVNSTHSSSESAILNRESRAGSNRSIVFNYIPSRDQREKEEEELWVANEAAYSNFEELRDERKSSDVIPETTPQVIPAVNFTISQEISETKNKSTSTSFTSQENTKDRSTVQMTTSATQTVYSCLLPLSYYSVPRRCNQRSSAGDRESAGSDHGLSGLPSVPSETQLREVSSDSAPGMATLLCSVNTAERRHFSARQRIVEPDAVKVAQNVKEATKKSSPDGPVGTNKEKQSGADAKSCPVTSAATNQPTKRFSFLIRSHSMEQRDKMTTMSASDKAILAKLAELKLEDIKENTNQKKPTSSASLHPPCRRCQQPVYPQERIQTSRDILFHSSCFKCYQCGARLNLKTFYRNPLTLRDYRIFCKSHVPALDPGKVFQECKTLGLPAKAETTSSATSCRSSLVSPAQNSVERVVVKGDTRGLRYF